MNRKNTFKANVVIDKQKASKQLSDLLLSSLQQSFTIDGIKFQLSKTKDPLVELRDASGNAAALISNLHVYFGKPEGLFSMEGEADLSFEAKFSFQTESNQQLFLSFEIENYYWKKEPKIISGSSDLKPESIAEYVIKHIEVDIIQDVLVTINEFIDINKSIVPILNKLAWNTKVYESPNLYVSLLVREVHIFDLDSTATSIQIPVEMVIQGYITDELLETSVNTPQLVWNNEVIQSKTFNQDVSMSITYKTIEEVIIQKTTNLVIANKQFQLETIHLQQKNEGFEIKAYLIQPIKGLVTICGVNYLDVEQQKLNIHDLSVELVAENLLYRLSSPIIESIIENKIEELFPLDCAEYLENIFAPFRELNYNHDFFTVKGTLHQLHFQSIEWTSNKINILASIQGNNLEVQIPG